MYQLDGTVDTSGTFQLTVIVISDTIGATERAQIHCAGLNIAVNWVVRVALRICFIMEKQRRNEYDGVCDLKDLHSCREATCLEVDEFKNEKPNTDRKRISMVSADEPTPAQHLVPLPSISCMREGRGRLSFQDILFASLFMKSYQDPKRGAAGCSLLLP